MSNFIITVAGIELNYKSEDLNIKKENNALRSSFNVAYSSYPFRIINDLAAKEALGDLSIKSVTKKISYNCNIKIGNSVYKAKLELKRPGGNDFIEVVVTFGSVLTVLSKRKIYEFLPDINVKGDNPLTNIYSDESLSPHNAQELFKSQAADYLQKTFPEVYFQYPEMTYRDKYDDTNKDEDHRNYVKKVNARSFVDGDLLINSTFYNNEEIIPYNYTAISPQVYAMAPIVRAFESLGYGVRGTFVEHPIFNLMLFTSFNDQMTKVQVLPPTTFYAISGNWQYGLYDFINGRGLVYTYFIKTFLPYPNTAGDYKVVVNLDMTDHPEGSGYGVYIKDGDGENIGKLFQFEPELFQQEFSFTVDQDNSTKEINFSFMSQSQNFPISYGLSIVPDVPDVNLYDAHPTIEFKRYVPDWNVIEAINNFKNLFNLDVYINDVEQVVYMNFNELQLIKNDWININARFRESGIQPVSQEYFSLGMENDEDQILLINKQGAILSNDTPENSTSIRSKFKEVPYSRGTAVLSEYLKDKSGVGLMFYDISAPPLIASSFAGVSLKMGGANGLYDNFWKLWLRYRLSASPLTLSGPLTNTEIIQIEKLQRFYMNNQKYIVDTMTVKDTGGQFLEVSLKVESVNF